MTGLGALTDELIAAWLAWDHACLNRPRYPTPAWCAPEAARLTAAERALAMPPGYTTTIAALRWHPDGRPNMSVGDAVETVVHELFPLARVDHLPQPRQHKEAS